LRKAKIEAQLKRPCVGYGAARGTKTTKTTGIHLSGRSTIVGRVPEDVSKVQKCNIHVELGGEVHACGGRKNSKWAK